MKISKKILAFLECIVIMFVLISECSDQKVNTQATQQVIDMVRNQNTPVIFFNRESIALDPIKAYGKSYYVGRNSKYAGTL